MLEFVCRRIAELTVFVNATSEQVLHQAGLDALVFGNETAVQARERFETAVSHLTQTHPQETIILTSHGTVLTLFISQHNPTLNAFQFWQALTMPQAFVLSWPEKKLLHTISV